MVNKSYFSALRSRININMNILLVDARISTEHVQYYFKAADYCVCPYRISLNSGVAHLSHTFNTPVIAPNIGGFKSLLSTGGGLMYDNGNIDDLYRVMKKSLKVNFTENEIELIDSNYEIKKISNDFHKRIINFSN